MTKPTPAQIEAAAKIIDPYAFDEFQDDMTPTERQMWREHSPMLQEAALGKARKIAALTAAAEIGYPGQVIDTLAWPPSALAAIERLRELLRGTGANRYWEGRWRDEHALNAELVAALEYYASNGGTVARAALAKVKEVQ